MPPDDQKSSYYYLLLDEQENVPSQEYFIHYVYKILTNEGLQEMSDITVQFDPSYEELTFHQVVVHRDGKIIHQIPQVIETIQRESDLEKSLYDGTLTALIHLKDIRVGDVIEYSLTRKGYNPIYENFISRQVSLNYNIPIDKIFQRLLVPSTLALTFKNINTTKDPISKKTNGLTEYRWELENIPGHIADKNLPDWYNPYETVQITNFKNWADVAAWAQRRFAVSPAEKNELTKQITTHIKSNTPEKIIEEAIRFVQDDIRYLGFESGLNSHKPHPPTQVLEQRFGDCKDKSLLLATILSIKGIESYPVLVNTTYRDRVSENLPSIHSFDHCIVQIQRDGDSFYIDPTISSQGGQLDAHFFPSYGKGLVVSNQTKDLIRFPAPIASSISERQLFEVPAIGGEATLRVETTYEGGEADYQRSALASGTLEGTQKNFLNYYANLYPDIETNGVMEIHDDREKNKLLIKEFYKISTFWKDHAEIEGKLFFEVYPQSIEGYFTVSKSAQRTSPYRLQFPLHYRHTIEIKLPESWPVTPEDEIIENDNYYYNHTITSSGENITLFTDYRTKRESVPLEDFKVFSRDHEKMMANLSYSVSYDKNIAAQGQNTVPGLILTILSLALGVLLVGWLYLKYDPTPSFAESSAEPIGGWLVLIGLGIIFTPVRILYDLLSDPTMLNGTVWYSYWLIGNYSTFLFIFLEHIYNIVYLLFSCLLIVLFLQRRSSFPLLASIRLGVACVVTLLDSYAAHQIDPSIEMNTKEIIQTIVAAAIWIPYFQQSERVKQTFLMRTRNRNDEDGEGSGAY